MPERTSKSKRPRDTNMLAKSIVDAATSEGGSHENTPEKNPAAVALGKLGGKKGGPARAKKLTPEQRKEIARKAAQARWNKEPSDSE